jgi:hypothetical protein
MVKHFNFISIPIYKSFVKTLSTNVSELVKILVFIILISNASRVVVLICGGPENGHFK